MEKRKRNIIHSKKRLLITCVIALAVLGGGAVAGVNLYLANSAAPVDASSATFVDVTIPRGSSTSKIGVILEENGLTRSASGFKLLAKLEGYDGKFKAGTYALSPSMDAIEIMDALTVGGSADTKRFMIPEGYTIAKTADKLEREGFVDASVFLDELENGAFDYKFMPALPEGPNRLEGFLFPETYDVFAAATEADIINRMLTQFDKEFRDEYYTRATELGYNVHDMITIASLIEAETRIDEDRPLVSSVIYNRLAINMALQLDATVQYALGETKERLYISDTQVDSPYNTYQILGLPPGPICSPGAAAIAAALYPADTEYIYYVLKPDESGGHNFAVTYSEFLRYKDQYIKSL